MRWTHFLSVFFATSLLSLEYEVRFIGITDPKALVSLIETSSLVALEKRPPPSLTALRYRIVQDIPVLLEVLQAYGYFDAEIAWNIEEQEEGYFLVDLILLPGIAYTLASYEVFQEPCRSPLSLSPCGSLCPSLLGLSIGSPVHSLDIVNAELLALSELARCGYPLAKVTRRKVEVDGEEKTVYAGACMEEGPLVHFGPIFYTGIESIDPSFLDKKIAWKEGEVYNSDLVASTQAKLLATELFSSVLISHAEDLNSQDTLPMHVRVSEAKHKQFSLGVYYATVDGFGGVVSWTNRNIRHRGETLSWKVDGSERFVGGNITYKKPDVFTQDQTYRATILASRENIFPYLSFLYRASNYLDTPIGSKGFVSAGLKFDHLNVEDSASNGSYWLAGLPFFAKYDTANSDINPTKGYTVAYSITPYQSLVQGNVHFAKQRCTLTAYLPFFAWDNLVFAGKVQFGAIGGAKQHQIPLPKLFLGGSEDTLRGYRYQSVSPLLDGKPLGGRSAIFGSIESRFRFGNIGIVPFFDFGSVLLSPFPSFEGKWFRSLGIGGRYFAFFGPLRFDIGFPLDRRKGIDHAFQLYASVGQAF